MFEIEAILADNIRCTHIETTRVLVLTVGEKKELTKIITRLNALLPLTKISLSHLKRIDSNKAVSEVIIAPVAVDCESNSTEIIIQQTIGQLEGDLNVFINSFEFDRFKLCNVPASAPLTRDQFNKASLFWPVSFHENKYISRCLNGTLFTTAQLERIFQLMRHTLDLRKHNEVHLDSDYCSNSPCALVSVVIVKRNLKHIVAEAISSTRIHPLNHAVIKAVNSVATIHQHAKSRQMDLSSELIDEYRDDYLCTNYDCFISQEPCIMCAMALVHSRIKRVFVFASGVQCDECADQPYSEHKLHIHSSLNHRYEVWKITNTTLPLAKSHSSKEFPNKKLKSTID